MVEEEIELLKIKRVDELWDSGLMKQSLKAQCLLNICEKTYYFKKNQISTNGLGYFYLFFTTEQ